MTTISSNFMWLYCFTMRGNSFDTTLIESWCGSVSILMRVGWLLLCDGLTRSDSLLCPLILHHRNHRLLLLLPCLHLYPIQLSLQPPPLTLLVLLLQLKQLH